MRGNGGSGLGFVDLDGVSVDPNGVDMIGNNKGRAQGGGESP